MTLFAYLTCAWCGHPCRCRQMADTGWWIGDCCWETAEGIEVAE